MQSLTALLNERSTDDYNEKRKEKFLKEVVKHKTAPPKYQPTQRPVNRPNAMTQICSTVLHERDPEV